MTKNMSQKRAVTSARIEDRILAITLTSLRRSAAVLNVLTNHARNRAKEYGIPLFEIYKDIKNSTRKTGNHKMKRNDRSGSNVLCGKLAIYVISDDGMVVTIYPPHAVKDNYYDNESGAIMLYPKIRRLLNQAN